MAGKYKATVVVALSFIAISAAAVAHILIARARAADTASHNSAEAFSATQPCPDVLVKRGDTIVLYNSASNPREKSVLRTFNNIDEYIEYVETQRAQGVRCPVLFLQEETDAQGNDVLRARPGPTDMAAGAKIIPAHSANLTLVPGLNNPSAIGANDSSYAPFDAHGFDVGRITALDAVHASTSTKTGECSENQMDSNWCGVAFTAKAVAGGNYVDNEIYKPVYSAANIRK